MARQGCHWHTPCTGVDLPLLVFHAQALAARPWEGAAHLAAVLLQGEVEVAQQPQEGGCELRQLVLAWPHLSGETPTGGWCIGLQPGSRAVSWLHTHAAAG